MKSTIKSNHAIAYLYVSLTSLLWGSSAAAGKLMLRDVSNLQLLLLASSVATVALFVIALIQKKIHIVKQYKLRDYKNFALLGLFGIVFYYSFYFAGLSIAPAQEVFIVNYTYPIWIVLLASIVLKEKFTLRKAAALLISFAGVCVVVTKGDFTSLDPTNLKGDLFALTGGVAYGVFSVLGKKHNYDKVLSMFFSYLFASVIIAIVVLVFDSFPGITPRLCLGALWIGIAVMALGFVFWFLALQLGDTAKMSNMLFLTPFLSLLYISLLTDEKIHPTSIAGLAVIVAGIIIQNYKKRPKRPAPEKEQRRMGR